jgi:hypothetical protein
MNSNERVEAKVGVIDSLEGKIIRGKHSWNFIYMALGFALAIEGTVVAMIPVFPWNIPVYVVLAFGAGRLFISSGRFQDKLLSIKRAYEDKPR